MPCRSPWAPNVPSALLVSCGWGHTVMVACDGTVMAWGEGKHGTLGDGAPPSDDQPSSSGHLGPVTVLGLDKASVRAVAAGVCFTVVLTSSGSLMSWGWGVNGRLGSNSGPGGRASVSRATPIPLSGEATYISAGHHHAGCVSGGRLFTWGWNKHGQLGHGKGSSAASAVPKEATGALEGKTVVSLACGWGHTLAVGADGTLWGAGCSANGQLGTGTAEAVVPEFRAVIGLPALAKVKRVACGQSHSLVLLSTGEVYAAGLNADGQLGLGHRIDAHTFALVEALRSVRIVQVACGDLFSAALAANGAVYAWGSSHYLQLGLGSEDSVLTPTIVSSLAGVRVKAISCGANHMSVLGDEEDVTALRDGTLTASGGFVGSESPSQGAAAPAKAKASPFRRASLEYSAAAPAGSGLLSLPGPPASARTPQPQPSSRTHHQQQPAFFSASMTQALVTVDMFEQDPAAPPLGPARESTPSAETPGRGDAMLALARAGDPVQRPTPDMSIVSLDMTHTPQRAVILHHTSSGGAVISSSAADLAWQRVGILEQQLDDARRAASELEEVRRQLQVSEEERARLTDACTRLATEAQEGRARLHAEVSGLRTELSETKGKLQEAREALQLSKASEAALHEDRDRLTRERDDALRRAASAPSPAARAPQGPVDLRPETQDQLLGAITLALDQQISRAVAELRSGVAKDTSLTLRTALHESEDARTAAAEEVEALRQSVGHAEARAASAEARALTLQEALDAAHSALGTQLEVMRVLQLCAVNDLLGKELPEAVAVLKKAQP
jgi:alpha-tubulin suppressor-like RCC1 family protein